VLPAPLGVHVAENIIQIFGGSVHFVYTEGKSLPDFLQSVCLPVHNEGLYMWVGFNDVIAVSHGCRLEFFT